MQLHAVCCQEGLAGISIFHQSGPRLGDRGLASLLKGGVPDVMLSVLPAGQLAWKLPLGKIAAEIEQTLEQTEPAVMPA